MSKQFLAVIAAIIILFVGIGVYNSNSKKQDSSSSKTTMSQNISGNPNAKVTIVEYGDYQCPYCQSYHANFKNAQTQYADKVKFQFRNFPLTSIHKNAMAAARAAEAAALQNKFWEMHDALYENANWSAWTKADDPRNLFYAYAEQLGLNVNQFKTDFASEKVNNIINADRSNGTKLGITGTPTFFVNGKEEKITNSKAGFDKVINKYLNQQN